MWQTVCVWVFCVCVQHAHTRAATRCLADWVVAPATSPPRPSPTSWRCNIVLNLLWRQCTHALPTVTTMQQQTDNAAQWQMIRNKSDNKLRTTGNGGHAVDATLTGATTIYAFQGNICKIYKYRWRLSPDQVETERVLENWSNVYFARILCFIQRIIFNLEFKT